MAAEHGRTRDRAACWPDATEVARLLRNEGATYNVTVDNQSRRRPWSLDPCPLVIDEAEWAGLESAVAQRVALLDLVFADIYGDRRLVAQGLVPAELVLGHPAFLRACVGMGADRRPPAVPHRRGRGPRRGGASSGPSATGSRRPRGWATPWSTGPSCRGCCPTLHRESGVERLAGFFRSIRAGVARAAPDGVDEPRVVILTPGPLSETYFEHAYLASYLGYSLVEGRDLVVANNRVWLRSLGGLDPVDVVIRRVDDQWCDPVELRADSLLGVPGLLEVARRGRVTVVNPLGSGVIEDPALTGLLDDTGPDPARRGPGPAAAPRPGGADDEPGSATCWPTSSSMMVLPVRPRPSDRPAGGVHAVGRGARRPPRPDPGPARASGWARRSSSRPPRPR